MFQVQDSIKNNPLNSDSNRFGVNSLRLKTNGVSGLHPRYHMISIRSKLVSRIQTHLIRISSELTYARMPPFMLL